MKKTRCCRDDVPATRDRSPSSGSCCGPSCPPGAVVPPGPRLTVLQASVAYFLCGTLRKERSEKKKNEKCPGLKKKMEAVSLFPFWPPSSHANKAPALLPSPGSAPGGKEGTRKPLLGATSQVPMSYGARPRRRAHTRTLPGTAGGQPPAPGRRAGAQLPCAPPPSTLSIRSAVWAVAGAGKLTLPIWKAN